MAVLVLAVARWRAPAGANARASSPSVSPRPSCCTHWVLRTSPSAPNRRTRFSTATVPVHIPPPSQQSPRPQENPAQSPRWLCSADKSTSWLGAGSMRLPKRARSLIEGALLQTCTKHVLCSCRTKLHNIELLRSHLRLLQGGVLQDAQTRNLKHRSRLGLDGKYPRNDEYIFRIVGKTRFKRYET